MTGKVWEERGQEEWVQGSGFRKEAVAGVRSPRVVKFLVPALRDLLKPEP
jgi:hypothetical protein